MKLRKNVLSASLALGAGLALSAARAEDWPMWGKDFSRNMRSSEKGVVFDFGHGKTISPDSEEIDMKTTKNVKWVAKVGSQSYGNVTVSNGKVFIGTNNDAPYHRQFEDDRSLMLALDEKTGKFLWQLTVPKLGSGKVGDWEYLGICSSPHVEGDRVYIVTNRCEVMCLDVNGQRDGNQGDQDEGQYFAGPKAKPVPVTEKDADIIWRFSMGTECGVFPHNITSSSVLPIGDKIYVVTSNGVDWSHTNIPNQKAPAIIVVDKKTGKWLARDQTTVSKFTLHANWSSPTLAKTPGGKDLIIFGAGDGFLYAFDTQIKPSASGDPVGELPVLWRVDCNPPEYRVDPKTNKVLRYAKGETGPSEMIATPVFYKDHIYIGIGQDPEHGPGWGNFLCVEAATGKVKWSSKEPGRLISTAAVDEDLAYTADYAGIIYCFDALNGKLHWKHDTLSHIWGSPLVVDGKVIIGNEDGILTVLAATKELKVIAEVDCGAPVYSSPVMANGVLYVSTPTHLWAIGK